MSEERGLQEAANRSRDEHLPVPAGGQQRPADNGYQIAVWNRPDACGGIDAPGRGKKLVVRAEREIGRRARRFHRTSLLTGRGIPQPHEEIGSARRHELSVVTEACAGDEDDIVELADLAAAVDVEDPCVPVTGDRQQPRAVGAELNHAHVIATRASLVCEER